jgi:hypothetical protein
VTASAKETAMAASTALPPSLRTSKPTCEAIGSELTTMPFAAVSVLPESGRRPAADKPDPATRAGERRGENEHRDGAPGLSRGGGSAKAGAARRGE